MGRPKLGYNGNEYLRPDGKIIELTEYQLEEMKKCKADLRYFIENYVMVTHLDRGEVLFKLHDFQKKILQSFHENRRTIVLCGRQAGKCVDYNTKVNKSGEHVKIGMLIPLTIKERIVQTLESYLMKLAK
jgi:hypothetical protein